MAWTAVFTYTVGLVVTAANLNTYLSSNTDFLKGNAGEIVLGAYPDYPNTAQGDIFYHNGTSLARLAFGTAGYFLKTQGTAANPIWASSGEFSAGTALGLNSAAVVNSPATTYGRVKATKIGRSGTVSVVFDLAGDLSYGKVYRNNGITTAVAVGTERLRNAAGFVTQPSEDFAVLAGDTLEIWAHWDGASFQGQVQNFKVLVSVAETIPFRDDT